MKRHKDRFDSEDSESLIFGHTWEQIRDGQQKRPMHKPIPPYDQSTHACRVQSDVDKFHIPVHATVKAALAIVLPDGYKLNGETWEFQP